MNTYMKLQHTDIYIPPFILLHGSSVHMGYIKGGSQISAVHSGGQSKIKTFYQNYFGNNS
jgi:hypothetical protein